MAEAVSSLFDNGEHEQLAQLAAAAVAQEANAAIRQMAESLDAVADNTKPVAFLCECGCLGFVEATVPEYDAAGGAWLGDHAQA